VLVRNARVGARKGCGLSRSYSAGWMMMKKIDGMAVVVVVVVVVDLEEWVEGFWE
jgi:hypothetical protein